MKRSFIGAFLFLGLISAALIACNNSSSPVTQAYVANVAHGKYLVDTVTGCADCHSLMDARGNVVDSLRFAGGQRFGFGPLGAVYSRNITQDSADGLGTWTDAEIITAIRTGIIPAHALNGTTRTDTVLFSVMPYALFSNYSDNDMADIVAYLRTIKPVRYSPPADTLPPAARVKVPPQVLPAPTVASAAATRGQYLAAVGLCADCHTQRMAPPAQGFDMTKFLAGGFSFDVPPFGTIYSANITPDSATGIGTWTDAQIQTALQQGKDNKGQSICPPMPWQRFAGLESSDVQALIAYLHNVPAINNQVPSNPNCP